MSYDVWRSVQEIINKIFNGTNAIRVVGTLVDATSVGVPIMKGPVSFTNGDALSPGEAAPFIDFDNPNGSAVVWSLSEFRFSADNSCACTIFKGPLPGGPFTTIAGPTLFVQDGGGKDEYHPTPPIRILEGERLRLSIQNQDEDSPTEVEITARGVAS